MRAAFAQPGFRRLFTGLSASMLGDSMLLLMLGIWVKDLTGSSAQAGLTFLFMALPSLVAPVLGVVIDRFRRRPLLIVANVLSALGVLPLLLVRDAGDVWLIHLVAAVYGVSFIVIPAALNGLLKEMLPEDLLADANGSLQTVKESFRLFGPLAGAGLFALTGGWAVALIDAATFLIAAAVVASIPVRESAPQRDEGGHWQELTAGVRHLVRDRVLLHSVVGLTLCLLVLGFSESAIFALTDEFHREPTMVSVMVSVQGVGAVLGGVVSSRIVHRLGEPASLALGLLLISISLATMAGAPTFWTATALMVPMGFGLPVLMVAYMTMLQRRTPHLLMGRVSAAIEVLLGTPQAVSLGVGALVVAFLDWRLIFVAMAAVIAVAAAYIALMLREEVRAHRRASALGDAVLPAEEGEGVGGVGAREGADLPHDDLVVSPVVHRVDGAVDIAQDPVQER